jgi:hypothetical protein
VLDGLLIAVGCLMAIYGLVGLVSAWLAPRVFSSRLYGRGMLTGRLAPTRVNRSLMSAWALLFGCYLAAFSAGHRTVSALLLLPVSVVVLALIFRRFDRGRDA